MNAPKNLEIASPAIAPEIVALVAGSLAPRNSVGTASVDFYVAVLAAAGVADPDSLSFAETVEVTRRLYAPSAEFRRDRAEIARAEKAKADEIARAKRDAEAKAKLVAKREALEKALAKLG